MGDGVGGGVGGGGDWNPLALKEFRVSPHPLPALGPGGYEGKPEDYEDQRTMTTVEVGVSRRPMFYVLFGTCVQQVMCKPILPGSPGDSAQLCRILNGEERTGSLLEFSRTF